MNLILVPGLWLDAESWSEVVAPLEAAGHKVHPVTLPGMESKDADRSGITLRDHIEAVIELVDKLPDPIVLVGHSGGGAVIHGVVDARPDRIVRAVYVDSGPLGDGDSIDADLPAVNGEIPLPDWAGFDETELVDLDDALRDEFVARAIPSPQRVAADQQVLHDERRYEVPVTIITCSFPSSMMQELIENGHPFVAELARVEDYEIVDLPTGHWPQFTRPTDLAEAILRAVAS
jgi:pimeloyl-ACP methyl ester carboxylesterase